jgi:hypothetical protein
MSIIETITAKLKTASPETARKVLDFLEVLESKAKPETLNPTTTWQEVRASLPGTSGFTGDPVEIQREMRTEWDRLLSCAR